MTIVDAILILFILSGAVLGFKKGAIKSLVALLGLIVLVVVSYYLKNNVANMLFDFVPFVNFTGSWEGLVTLNILLFEAGAYFAIFIVLYSILNLIIRVSGIVERILNATIILGIPSKIMGTILGFIEAIVFSFLVLFILLQLNETHALVENSVIARTIINKTPIVGTMINDTNKAIKEINDLNEVYKDYDNKDIYNAEILKIMLKYEVVTPEVTQKLIDNRKLDFDNVQNVLDEYKENANG